MLRMFTTAAVAFAIFGLGALMSTGASAGGGQTRTVTREGAASKAAARHRAYIARHRSTEITEFSSSSAGYNRPSRPR